MPFDPSTAVAESSGFDASTAEPETHGFDASSAVPESSSPESSTSEQAVSEMDTLGKTGFKTEPATTPSVSRTQNIRNIMPEAETLDKVLQSVPTISPVLAALPEDTRKQIIAGTEDTAAGLLDFTTSPAGIGTAIGTALAPEIAVPAFAAHGLKSALSESVPALLNAKNVREATSAIEGLGMNAAMVLPGVLGGTARPTELTPPQQAVSQMLDQGHSLEDIQQAVNDHRQWTVSTTIGKPTPLQEAQRMLANMGPRKEQPIIGKDTQPLQPATSGGEITNATQEISQPESVRPQLEDRNQGGEKPETSTGDSLLSQAPEQVAHDWTSATEESPKIEPTTMKKASGESGAIPSPAYPTRVMSELDQATATRSAKLQKSFDEAQRAQKEIKRVIPDKARQQAATIYREANGDIPTLQIWEGTAKQDWMRNAAKTAQTLTPEEIAVVDKSKAAFDVLERRGNAYGVLTTHRDNYVPHIWEVAKDKGFTGSRRLQERFKFNKARTLDTFYEGDQAGLKPKDFTIGNILPAYLSEMNKVIADRQFVEDLAKSKTNTGEPLAVPLGRVTAVDNPTGKAVLVTPKSSRTMDTSDYRVMPDQPALSDWTWEGKDTDGKPVFVKADLALHPEAYERVKSMLGKSPIREWYDSPSKGGAAIPKAIAKGLDTAQAVMKREMFSLLSPFHQVQEGTHAIGHTVNPFFGIPKIDLRVPEQMDAARHGLMLLPDRTVSSMYMEGAGGKGGFISQAARLVGEKLNAKAVTAVADVVDGYQDYLFHQYIPGLKFKTYQSILERNTKLYDSELKSGKLADKDIKLLSAEQANAAYGHLNYDLLDRSPLMKHLAQLTLLAPDFLEARSRFVTQGLKTLTGSKAGWEQFRAIAILAMVQAGVAYTISKLLGDEWDEKHPFEVKHGNRRYSMRSVPEDIASSIAEPRKFMYGRINPLLVKGAVQGITGLNYRGEKADFWTDTVPELLAQYIPISARNLPGIRQLTSATRQNPVSNIEQYAGTVGLRISRYSPISDVYKKAGDWMDAQKIPHDKGSYPVSKYSQLRYALEDDDTERATKAYAELRKTMNPLAIGKGFIESTSHPFTQNRKMDVLFYRSLNAAEKQVFDLAAKRRRELVWRFGKLPKQ